LATKNLGFGDGRTREKHGFGVGFGIRNNTKKCVIIL